MKIYLKTHIISSVFLIVMSGFSAIFNGADLLKTIIFSVTIAIGYISGIATGIKLLRKFSPKFSKPTLKC